MSRFATLSHPKAGRADVQHIYRDAHGETVLIANRYEGKGKKFFLPYDVANDVWKAPEDRPLYRLPELLAANDNEPVIVVEGEQCADALAALGYVTTTTFGGANAAQKTDLVALQSRKVILWPDADEAGLTYAQGIALTLHKGNGASAQIIPIDEATLCKVTSLAANANAPKVTLHRGWDAADAIASGWGRAEIAALLRYAQPYPPVEVPPPNVSLEAASGEIEAWHTPEGEAYVTIPINGHFEHMPIASSKFKKFLSFQHYQREGKPLSQTALEELRRSYEGEALFAGEEHRAFNRIGEMGRTLYLDLGEKDWKAVAIDAQGWQVIDRPPARFTRAGSSQALPIPEKGSGNIDLLRPFLNVGSEEDYQMLVAWLIGCFHPRGPYPILILNGEQGSAKSTTAKVLRSLIDPANPMARSTPNSEQDLVIAAKHNHVLSFDNLSNVKATLSDAFCRIATGGGFGTRKLHTDSEESLFTATRPCLLNGIPDLAHRADLADRSIVVHLPVIDPTERQFEGEFNKRFEAAKPRILAGLLDAVSIALCNLSTVTLTERPRMADFAKWVVAAEPALGWPEGAFLESYAANRGRSDSATVEGHPVGLAILKLMQDDKRWRGTVTDLKTLLRNRYPDVTEDAYSFPRQANKLSAAVRRLAPPLRRMGIEIGFDRSGKSGERQIEITVT